MTETVALSDDQFITCLGNGRDDCCIYAAVGGSGNCCIRGTSMGSTMLTRMMAGKSHATWTPADDCRNFSLEWWKKHFGEEA